MKDINFERRRYMKLTKRKDKNELEKEMDLLLKEMKGFVPGSPDYLMRLETLERLNKLDSEKKSRKIKPDTVAIIFGNLLGICMILSYERVNIITSKAVGFILKGRV